MEITPLKRSMKTTGVLLIILSAITPASSVFIIAPTVMQQAGTGAFISFMIAAVIGIFTAQVYAELSSAFPLTGGEYAIVGRILGPFWGFIVLGVNLISLIFMLSALSLGIATYLQPLFPHVPTIAAGVAAIVATTFLGVLNIRTNAVITGAFLILEMLALIVLTWLGFANISRPLTEFLTHPVFLNSSGALQPTSLSLIGLATAVAVWAYNGYGNTVYLGEETHDAPKRMARIIIWSLIITVIAEAVPVTAVLLGAPDLAGLLGSKNMLPDFIIARGGMQLNILVSLGVALAIINANVATILITARQLYSTGRDHVWPHWINHALTRIHKKYHSPWIATLVCGALSVAACFLDMQLLFVIIGSSLVFIYGALCVAVLVGRRKGSTDHGHYRMPWYPLPPILALIAMFYTVFANYLDAEVGRPSLWATLGMMVLSGLYYRFYLRRRGEWILHAPEEEK